MSLTDEKREALAAGIREVIEANAVWAVDPVSSQVDAVLDMVAPYAEALTDARETITALGDAYREAIGVPESDHQYRRMEVLATELEASREASRRVLDLCDQWDRLSKGESPTTAAIRAAAALPERDGGGESS